MEVREKQSSEKRLIDANALMYVISQHEYLLATKQGSIDYGMFTLGIQQAVDEQPTIDAVPVTRCKDCKYMTQWAYGRYCTVWDGVNRMGDDGFCNYGERREDNNNG